MNYNVIFEKQIPERLHWSFSNTNDLSNLWTNKRTFIGHPNPLIRMVISEDLFIISQN